MGQQQSLQQNGGGWKPMSKKKHQKWIDNRTNQSDDLRDWRLFIDSAYNSLDWSKITSHSELVQFCNQQQRELNMEKRRFTLAEQPADCILKLQSMRLAWLYLDSVSNLFSLSNVKQEDWERGVKAPMTLFIKYFQFNPQKLNQFWLTNKNLPTTVNDNNSISFHSSLAWLLDSATKLNSNLKGVLLESFDASVKNLKRQSKNNTWSQDIE